MDPAVNRGHLIIIRAWFLRVLLLWVISIPVVIPTCPDGDFQTDSGICCAKCSAGYKLVEECHGRGFRTNCESCPAGQYMDKINYARNCIACKVCKARIFEIEVSKCTKSKNTVCRCMDGYYKSAIDSVTYECFKCSTCGDNEIEHRKCSPEANTECTCKKNYYKVGDECLPFTNSTAKPDSTRQGDAASTLPFLVNVIAGAAVVVALTLVLVIIVTHFVTKRQTEKKLLSSQDCKESSKIYEELSVHCEQPSDHSLLAVNIHSVTSQEPSNLPDCVPLEIKIPDVIYILLDLVPVQQVKQLVRSLGVSDAVIERAELDYRSSREAHYQMLRSWAEQGSPTRRGRAGQGGVLHLPLLHLLLDKLRGMHLEQTAQELETKYNLL